MDSQARLRGCVPVAVFWVNKATFIRTMLERLVSWCDEHHMREYGLLYLAAYAFLLRLPSEALGMEAGGSPSSRHLGQSVLTRCKQGLTLHLRRR